MAVRVADISKVGEVDRVVGECVVVKRLVS